MIYNVYYDIYYYVIIFSRRSEQVMMLVLTGEKECGKSSLLRDVIAESGISAQGFISLKVVSNGEVKGISLLILPEKRSFPMATTTPLITSERTPRFFFYPRVFDLVNRHFHHIQPHLPFVFDEFGSLEMSKKGHYPVFELLKKSQHPTLMIVRNNIVGNFLSMYCKDVRYTIMDMNKYSQANLHKSILSFLKGETLLDFSDLNQSFA
jgi:nucleoside-triphosphatase THEP1